MTHFGFIRYHLFLTGLLVCQIPFGLFSGASYPDKSAIPIGDYEFYTFVASLPQGYRAIGEGYIDDYDLADGSFYIHNITQAIGLVDTGEHDTFLLLCDQDKFCGPISFRIVLTEHLPVRYCCVTDVPGRIRFGCLAWDDCGFDTSGHMYSHHATKQFKDIISRASFAYPVPIGSDARRPSLPYMFVASQNIYYNKYADDEQYHIHHMSSVARAGSLWDGVKDFFGSATNGIKDGIQSIIDSFTGIWNEVLDAIEKFGSDIIATIITINNRLDEFSHGLLGAWERHMKLIFDNLGLLFTDPVSFFVKVLKDSVDNFIAAVPAVLGLIADALIAVLVYLSRYQQFHQLVVLIVAFVVTHIRYPSINIRLLAVGYLLAYGIANLHAGRSSVSWMYL